MIFKECWQHKGESFDEFFVSLKELADDAELCSSCLDDRLVTCVASGVADQNLHRKLLVLDPPQVYLRLCVCVAARSLLLILRPTSTTPTGLLGEWQAGCTGIGVHHTTARRK